MLGTKKKASIGAAMTWVVATIIIFFMSILFVYVAFIIAEDKKVFSQNFFIEKADSFPLISLYSENMLLALLKTNFEEKKLKDSLDLNYQEFNLNFVILKKNLNPLIERLPRMRNPAWFAKDSAYYWSFRVVYDKPYNIFYFGDESEGHDSTTHIGKDSSNFWGVSPKESSFVNLQNVNVWLSK
jgi:hypothetical protein